MLHSLIGLIGRDADSLLREASLIGTLSVGAFMAFWNALVFLLEGKSCSYAHPGEATGLFGPGGVVGTGPRRSCGRIATARPASHAGHRACGHAPELRPVLGGRVSLVGTDCGREYVVFAVPSAHVSTPTRIDSLIPEARSRLNTVYMVSYFWAAYLGTSLGARGWRLCRLARRLRDRHHFAAAGAGCFRIGKRGGTAIVCSLPAFTKGLFQPR